MLHENVKVLICLIIDIHNYILPEKTEHAKYSAKDLTIRHDNRRHGIIFRLKTDVVSFAIEGLDRRGIIDQSYNHIAIGRRLTLLHKNGISIKNTCIDHGLALDLQHKALLVGHELHGYREIGFHIFHRQNWLSGSHTAHDRYIHHLTAAGGIEAVIDDFDSAGLGGVAADIAVLFQSLQMGMNGRRGLSCTASQMSRTEGG